MASQKDLEEQILDCISRIDNVSLQQAINDSTPDLATICKLEKERRYVALKEQLRTVMENLLQSDPTGNLVIETLEKGLQASGVSTEVIEEAKAKCIRARDSRAKVKDTIRPGDAEGDTQDIAEK